MEGCRFVTFHLKIGIAYIVVYVRKLFMAVRQECRFFKILYGAIKLRAFKTCETQGFIRNLSAVFSFHIYIFIKVFDGIYVIIRAVVCKPHAHITFIKSRTRLFKRKKRLIVSFKFAYGKAAVIKRIRTIVYFRSP